jgi:hypothetical protein
MTLKVQAAVTDDGKELTPELRSALCASSFPLVIPFFGSTGAGKSTRLNQVLTGVLGSSTPFPARGGSSAVTTGFDFCSRVSLRDLCGIHSVAITLPRIGIQTYSSSTAPESTARPTGTFFVR